MRRPTFDRRDGRALFGADPAAYEAGRPGHPNRVYEVLVERCGLAPGAEVLEIGPGTGQATRRLLELGATRLVAVEPDKRLAAHVGEQLPEVEVVASPLEEAALDAGAFDLAVAASAFHWIDEARGLAVVRDAVRPDGWWAMWWTLFGEGERRDDFMRAIDHLFDLERSPSAGREGGPPFALDVHSRLAALQQAGYVDAEHENVRWTVSWDVARVRALYSTFSPIQRLEETQRESILDEVALIAARDFGGEVKRTLLTSLYTARRS